MVDHISHKSNNFGELSLIGQPGGLGTVAISVALSWFSADSRPSHYSDRKSSMSFYKCFWSLLSERFKVLANALERPVPAIQFQLSKRMFAPLLILKIGLDFEKLN